MADPNYRDIHAENVVASAWFDLTKYPQNVLNFALAPNATQQLRLTDDDFVDAIMLVVDFDRHAAAATTVVDRTPSLTVNKFDEIEEKLENAKKIPSLKQTIENAVELKKANKKLGEEIEWCGPDDTLKKINEQLREVNDKLPKAEADAAYCKSELDRVMSLARRARAVRAQEREGSGAAGESAATFLWREKMEWRAKVMYELLVRLRVQLQFLEM